MSEERSSESSDDGTSLNSVVNIDDTDSESVSVTAEREAESAEADQEDVLEVETTDSELQMRTDDDDSTSDSEDSMRREQELQGDSDSSSSSESTQIWVPATPKPVPPPRPNNLQRNSMSNSSMFARNSIVSQNSLSGKVETSLAPDEHHGVNGDSGISNESRETHGSLEHTHITPMVVSMATPSPGSSPEPAPGIKKDETFIKEQAEMQAKFRQSLFNILSSIYAMLLVVVGAVLPIAEIFAEPVAPGVFEGFYIYLFLAGIIFLTYVYLFLLRTKTSSHLRRRRRQRKKDHDSLLNHRHEQSLGISVDFTQSHTGSFYLRLGGVGFGIGAMIHEGLMFGQLVELKLISPCVNIAQAIRPIVHLVFTFVQLYFIFLNSKMCIHRYRMLAKFGLMHMIATNVCVWLRTVVMESIRQIRQYMSQHRVNIHGMFLGDAPFSNTTLSTPPPPQQAQHSPHGAAVPGNTSTLTASPHQSGLCHHHGIMTKVVEAASPYLYPCTIEYSLIAAGILYIMWRNISVSDDRSDSKSYNDTEQRSKKNRLSVDCSGANRGLFFGIFILVATIICLVVFFVLVDKPLFVESAVMLVHVAEVVMYVLATFAVCIAAFRMRDLKFHWERDNTLDESLLFISQMGVYLFAVFSIVAGRYNTHTYGGSLVIATTVLIMAQATIQTVFILGALRRSSRRPYHESRKAGREYITFLLVCNIAMWGISTFEELRSESNPIQMQFYGFLPWSIVTHMSTPLAIFYRFHSTVCLANIWKNAYKLKLH